MKLLLHTLASEKSVQYVAQCLASADSHCACARFCYFVSPWVTFQKFWNNNWIKICVDCYFNIFMLRRRILQRKRKSRRKLSAMWRKTLSWHYANHPPVPYDLWVSIPVSFLLPYIAPSSVSGEEIYSGGFRVSQACACRNRSGTDSVTYFWSRVWFGNIAWTLKGLLHNFFLIGPHIAARPAA